MREETIERDGYTAVIRDHGFASVAIKVQHTIAQADAEADLCRRGYDTHSCEWEFCPSQDTPADYLPSDDELPLGRVIHGDGYRASIRRNGNGHEAIYVDGPAPWAKIAKDLQKRGISIAPDCKVWRVPDYQPPKDDPAAPHRARFFGIFKGRRHVFSMAGLTAAIAKDYYCRQFDVDSMSRLSPQQWAIAAAEIACIGENVDLLHRRAPEMRDACKSL